MRSLILPLLAAFALAALATVTACAPEGELADHTTPGPPFHFNITALPAEYQPWFAEAAEEWNTATGKTLIVIDPQGEHVARMGADLADGRAICGSECTVVFSTTPGTPWMYDAHCPHPYFHTVALHELGHILGAPHLLDPAALMSAAPATCGFITDVDVAALRW